MNEKCELEANGLKFWTGHKSQAEPLGNIDQQVLLRTLNQNFSSLAYAVAWFDHEVLIGLWENQDFRFHESRIFELKYLQRLRVFDANRELHVWRTNGAWKGRLRSDGRGDDTVVVVAHQLLFGTRGKRLSPGFAKIEEDRGTKLILPLQHLHFDKDGNPSTRVCIKTHNYVKTNAVHQATYFDCRFVAFTDANYNELS